MNRIFLAGLLGGIAMFIWTSIAHMALPLGEAGIKEIPNESTVLGAMQSNIRENSGLYIFPGLGLGPNPSRQEQHQAMKRMEDNVARDPSGLLMYHPAGSRPMQMARWLLVEFATELIEAFLIVFLLSRTRLTTFGARVGFVLTGGLLAALATNVSYWNWYGFPAIYTASYMSIQVIGFLCVGLLAALVLKNKSFGTTA